MCVRVCAREVAVGIIDFSNGISTYCMVVLACVSVYQCQHVCMCVSSHIMLQVGHWEIITVTYFSEQNFFFMLIQKLIMKKQWVKFVAGQNKNEYKKGKQIKQKSVMFVAPQIDTVQALCFIYQNRC